MNFFEHQERARRNTWLLLLYFCVAVALIVFAVNLSFSVVLALTGHLSHRQAWWGSQASLVVSLVTLLFVCLRSLFKYLELRGGGVAVAEMVGARPVGFSPTAPAERQLLNVTEEMAIASGVAPPRVFVMDNEPGINAFVAGLNPSETVLVVTQGTLSHLSRDQLQAVVGHEFSHVLNGDVKLNVRLMATLAGILAIGQLGSFLLRAGSELDWRDRGSRRRGGVSGTLMLAGVLLYAVGYIGLFFGRLIKAAISRQREFLADASSVQFTRNPSAMADALLQIRDMTEGSRWRSRYAEDLSHMCFATTLNLSALLATHPPLEDRIKAVDPSALARSRARKHKARVVEQRQAAVSTPSIHDDRDIPIPFTAGPVALAPLVLVQQVGGVLPKQVNYAHRLLARIPSGLQRSLETPQGARLVVFALLLQGGGTVSGVPDSSLEGLSTKECESVDELRREISTLSRAFHLPLLELTLPRLLTLPKADRKGLLEGLTDLAKRDGRLSLFEFVLLVLLRHQLLDVAAPLSRHSSLESVKDAFAILIASLLGQVGGIEAGDREKHYDRLMKGSFRDYPPYASVAAVGRLSGLYGALKALSALSPLLKKAVLDTCSDAVWLDGKVDIHEIELLRAVSAVLDVPMPPLPEAESAAMES